jgi:peptidylprolyl isomerase
MKKVQEGDFVTVHYTGKLSGGEVFDTSRGREPLEVQVGAGTVIPGFDEALRGMEENETKNFILEPEKAYGQHDENLQRSFQRSDLPEDLDPKVGDTLALKTSSGEQVPVWVSEADENQIKIDMNHPLAGKTLNFEIEVMSINDTQNQQQSSNAG